MIDDEFTIGEITSCDNSENTFDIKFSDLAMNEDLLTELHLVSFTSIIRFADYMASFTTKEHRERKKRFLENPILRLLIIKEDLLKRVKEILEPEQDIF